MSYDRFSHASGCPLEGPGAVRVRGGKRGGPSVPASELPWLAVSLSRARGPAGIYYGASARHGVHSSAGAR